MIQTAEDFLKKNTDYVFTKDVKQDILDVMIGFAKLYVEAALKEASENAKVAYEVDVPLNGDERKSFYVDPKSILNSYPLTNIK